LPEKEKMMHFLLGVIVGVVVTIVAIVAWVTWEGHAEN
jgi:hypothetical protein